MNKKFLSAILFGALMVTSTGTFVSCKDYDDDIDRLDQEISNVKDAIKALEDKVGSGKYVESCTPFTDGNGGYEIKFSDGETIKLYNGAKVEQGERRLDVVEYIWYCIALNIDPRVGIEVVLDHVNYSSPKQDLS